MHDKAAKEDKPGTAANKSQVQAIHLLIKFQKQLYRVIRVLAVPAL